MNSFSSAHFQLLKSEVLKNAGIQNIMPADCKSISSQISDFTKQVISETTLKRIFGFALSKFNPSQYTIDLMARYCGYAGWKDFCDQKNSDTLIVSNGALDWENLKTEATRITEFTLHALKNRSGIPFNQTIERRTLDNQMDHFIASDYMGTVFAAPTGYGKSIALCHWVEQQLQLSYAKYNDDIILFFSSHALMSALHSGKDLVNWMLALLGYHTQKGIIALSHLVQKENSKFYLIIDGFDPHLLKNEQFNILISQLTDLFSLRNKCDFLKIVLTMRTSTWVNHINEWTNDQYSWFNTLNAGNNFINLPVLSIKEISEIRTNINPADKSPVTLTIAQTLTTPLYLQYYYKQHRSDFSLSKLDSLSGYDIISVFIANKIYMCTHSAEKIMFIINIISEMDTTNDVYRVDKLKVYNLIKQNSAVYAELISYGVFKEINESDNYRYNNYIAFNDVNILDHFLAKKFLTENDNLFSNSLVEAINTRLKSSSHKLPVLKWCIMDVIKTGELQKLIYLKQLELTTVQRAELIGFIADVLKREVVDAERLAPLLSYFKTEDGETAFDYFFGLELININYKDTLYTLLKLDLTDRQKITVYTALAISAAIKLDLNEMENAILEMSKLPLAGFYTFPIDPLTCVDAIFHYFKFGFVKRDALQELTKAMFALTTAKQMQINGSAINDMVFLLGIYTLWLTDNPKKVLRCITTIERTYGAHHDGKKTPYKFFLELLKSDAYFKIDNTAKVKEIYNHITSAYSQHEGCFTPFMKALYLSLKIKMFLNEQPEHSLLNELKNVNAITEDSGNKFSKVYILMLLLKNSVILSANPQLKKQAGHDCNMILTRSGIDRDRFQI